MQIEAGLIVERGTDETGEPLYGFVHRTFQEYFAAVDRHLCYQQEETPKIISDFLQEHLHDPHWHEVILLLLGKLPSRPATRQLSLILESTSDKPFSQRSKYTDIVQQDLFFVSSCLSEEIAVENNLAEAVVMRLSDMVKNSPITPQREETLSALGNLMQTRQYSLFAQRALVTFVNQEGLLDTSTRVKAAKVLFQCSPINSCDRQLALQAIAQFTRYPILSVQQVIDLAILLHQSPLEKDQKVASQLLSLLASYSSLPIEETVRYTTTRHRADLTDIDLEWIRREILIELVKRQDLSMKDFIYASGALYEHSYLETEEEKIAQETLIGLVKRSDISTENLIYACGYLYEYSLEGTKEEITAKEILISLAERPDLPMKDVVDIALVFYGLGERGTERWQIGDKLMLELASKANLSTEFLNRIS